MSSVRLESVSKHFGDVVAVDEMIGGRGQGTAGAGLGPSGCGKSTTLRMIAGLEQPPRTISIGERMLPTSTHGPQHRDGLPELRAVSPHEVFRNMAFGLQMRKVARRRFGHG
ncbi:MAG: hypothetical protein Ct9H300mP1_31540 [Planctomycetaceae bacterium]|nr:MAG: hypothetical protein Ct9H300mP1_31540 [Planctomycetaceae bacterium]